jgi:hypothetical protein
VLNRCRLTLKLLFLLDMAMACGQFLDNSLLLDQFLPQGRVLWFIFPNKQPSRIDWKLWREFWSGFSSPGGSLSVPLEDWLHPTHHHCEWPYSRQDNLILHQLNKKEVTVYALSEDGQQLHSGMLYQQPHTTDQLLAHCFLATILVLSNDQVLH